MAGRRAHAPTLTGETPPTTPQQGVGQKAESFRAPERAGDGPAHAIVRRERKRAEDALRERLEAQDREAIPLLRAMRAIDLRNRGINDILKDPSKKRR